MKMEKVNIENVNYEEVEIIKIEDSNNFTMDFEVDDTHFYVAPFYKEHPVRDQALLDHINSAHPDYVILAIAGGKQEVLGHWLRDQVDHKPAIVCIGAAIAFLSGHQASIPPWADRIYIGWFLRILADPKTFIPRYWKARKLSRIVFMHGEESPVGPNAHHSKEDSAA